MIDYLAKLVIWGRRTIQKLFQMVFCPFRANPISLFVPICVATSLMLAPPTAKKATLWIMELLLKQLDDPLQKRSDYLER